MYWKRIGHETQNATVAYHDTSEMQQWEYAIVTEAGETYRYLYLVCDDASVSGYIHARHGKRDEFQPVTSFPIISCDLGPVAENREYSVTLRLRVPVDATGNHLFPVSLVGSSVRLKLNTYFSSEWPTLWLESFERFWPAPEAAQWFPDSESLPWSDTWPAFWRESL